MASGEMSLREQLEACNKFLDTFWNLIPGGIGVYEFDKKKAYPIYLSPGVSCLCNGFEEDFYRKARGNALHMLAEGEQKKLYRAMQDVMDNHMILDCTLRYYKTPKKNGWVWVRGKLVQESGRRNILIAVVLDVTHQKNLENELQLQNERYRILEETSDEILFEVNVDDDVMTYSFKEMDGELIRKRISRYFRSLEKNSMVHPDYQDVFKKNMQIALGRCINGQMEYLSRISGHGYEWHRICYTSLADENGHVTRIIGRIKNIHDEVLARQKKQEELEFGLNHITGVKQRIWEKLENCDFEDKHTMAIISINNYKHIIEQNGVAWGDTAIHGIADILKDKLGESAIMGRTSDGEVLMYFQNYPNEKLDSKMEDILQEVQKPEHQVAGLTVECTVGASIMQGIVDYTAFYQETEEALHIAKITKGEHYIRV